MSSVGLSSVRLSRLFIILLKNSPAGLGSRSLMGVSWCMMMPRVMYCVVCDLFTICFVSEWVSQHIQLTDGSVGLMSDEKSLCADRNE